MDISRARHWRLFNTSGAADDFCASSLAAGSELGLKAATRNALASTVVRRVIKYRVVLGLAVVPHGNGIGLPLKANHKFRLLYPLKEHRNKASLKSMCMPMKRLVQMLLTNSKLRPLCGCGNHCRVHHRRVVLYELALTVG